MSSRRHAQIGAGGHESAGRSKHQTHRRVPSDSSVPREAELCGDDGQTEAAAVSPRARVRDAEAGGAGDVGVSETSQKVLARKHLCSGSFSAARCQVTAPLQANNRSTSPIVR
jgi:hypothetical protein